MAEALGTISERECVHLALSAGSQPSPNVTNDSPVSDTCTLSSTAPTEKYCVLTLYPGNCSRIARSYGKPFAALSLRRRAGEPLSDSADGPPHSCGDTATRIRLASPVSGEHSVRGVLR